MLNLTPNQKIKNTNKERVLLTPMSGRYPHADWSSVPFYVERETDTHLTLSNGATSTALYFAILAEKYPDAPHLVTIMRNGPVLFRIVRNLAKDWIPGGAIMEKGKGPDELEEGR